MDWEWAFLYKLSVELQTFLVGGPWKSHVVLEKSLKMVATFCMNPEFMFISLILMTAHSCNYDSWLKKLSGADPDQFPSFYENRSNFS